MATLLSIGKNLQQEKIDSMTNIAQVQKQEYDAILQRSVAIINRVKTLPIAANRVPCKKSQAIWDSPTNTE